jgi:hypothetical protein
MAKNKWKNNDLMPKVGYKVSGRKITFRGKPSTYQDKGKEILSFGTLSADTVIPVGEENITFMANSYIYFYESGAVREGISAKEDTVEIEDATYSLAARGNRQYYESGALRSAELDDGSVLKLDENGEITE